jgi:hypothetical protein
MLAGIAVTMLSASSLVAGEDGGQKKFTVRAGLVGLQEVPAISTVANGTFKADVDLDAGTITWVLRYSGLEGNVTQAHVHFGQDAGLPATTSRSHRCHHGGRGHRTRSRCRTSGGAGPGHRAGCARGNRGGHARWRHLRQRAYLQVAGRRNPRPVEVSGDRQSRPVPRKGAGRGSPQNLVPIQKKSHGAILSCNFAAGLPILR